MQPFSTFRMPLALQVLLHARFSDQQLSIAGVQGHFGEAPLDHRHDHQLGAPAHVL